MSDRAEFNREMARIIVHNFSMKPEALAVVEKWEDWNFFYSMGFRKESAGQAYQEWLKDL
ncbi:MAG: hypothetical protein JO226_21150 [Pluralibacter sp.]|nr:hypothetical protein [Pluralibacter sp.]